MEPRKCEMCYGDGLFDYGEGDEDCRSCNGTGKVWPSVSAEQARVVKANGLTGIALTATASFDVPFDGDYLIICQPLSSPDGSGTKEVGHEEDA